MAATKERKTRTRRPPIEVVEPDPVYEVGPELLSEEDRILTSLQTDSLYEFFCGMWPTVEPATVLTPGWHLEAICDHLQATAEGHIQHLLITIAPRMTKSLCASVAFPAWAWIKWPHFRYLYGSYSADLSLGLSLLSRRVLQSEWYQQRWADRFTIGQGANQKEFYDNDKTGFRISTSVGGTITGKGGDFLILDDPHNLNEVHSETIRKSVVDWYKQVWYTRANDPKKVHRIVIMQRGHEADLCGAEIIPSGLFVHLNLPTEFNPKKRCIIDKTKWQDPRTEAGELLCPDRFGPREVAEAKRIMGSYGYSAQHDQEPSPAEGGILKSKWFRWYREVPADIEEIVSSWDCTFKDLSDSDYVVGEVWARRRTQKFLLYGVRGQWGLTETCRQMKMVAQKFPNCLAHYVEDKANGPAVMQTMRDLIDGIIPIEPEGGKEARAAAVSPTLEAGNVYLPDTELFPDMLDFIQILLKECDLFPRGTNDDTVDSFTQAMNRMREGGILAFYRQQVEATQGPMVPVKESLPWHTPDQAANAVDPAAQSLVDVYKRGAQIQEPHALCAECHHPVRGEYILQGERVTHPFGQCIT